MRVSAPEMNHTFCHAYSTSRAWKITWVRIFWSVNKINTLQQIGGQRRGRPGYV